jgi:hypothetical protein
MSILLLKTEDIFKAASPEEIEKRREKEPIEQMKKQLERLYPEAVVMRGFINWDISVVFPKESRSMIITRRYGRVPTVTFYIAWDSYHKETIGTPTTPVEELVKIIDKLKAKYI